MVTLPWHTFTPDGLCIAMLHDLPDGTTYATHGRAASEGWTATASRRNHPMPYHLPVVVVAWPDGITPTAPSDDDGWIYTDDADEIAAAIDAGLRVDVHWPSADADEWVPLHASNRNSLAVGTLLAGGFTFRIAR